MLISFCEPLPPLTSVVRFSAMTTVLSQKGQIVLPVPVREQLHLSPGDDFEVAVEDEDGQDNLAFL